MRGLALLVGCAMIGSGLGGARPAHLRSQPDPTTSDQPFSRANIVLAHTTSRPDSVLDALVHHIQREGFTLDTLDPVRGLVTTKVELESAYRQGDIKIRAVRLASGTDWKLTGTYVIAAYGSGVAYPAEFRALEAMPATTYFRMVEHTAQAIPRARLRYARGKVPFGVATRLEKALQATW